MTEQDYLLLMKINSKLNYIGSKHSLIEHLSNVINETVSEGLNDKIFCDIFGGTHTVGKYFSRQCKKIIVNDLEYYSFLVGKCYFKTKLTDNVKTILNKFDSMSSTFEGFIFHNYSENGNSKRLYFSEFNGKRIDFIRTEIERLKTEGVVDDDEYCYLLVSLLEASDKVANTASVYGAYLKKIKASASKQIKLLPYFRLLW